MQTPNVFVTIVRKVTDGGKWKLKYITTMFTNIHLKNERRFQNENF